jgi:glycosyltransferase involved in cell wall biosynthesis
VFISDLSAADRYQASILQQAQYPPWAGKVSVTGYLPADEVGRILAAADALILPFKDGGGMWNTSIRAAISQGTFVLTTSREQHGYVSDENVYYARLNDIADMRNALSMYIGRRNEASRLGLHRDWDLIAQAHLSLYHAVAPAPMDNSLTGVVAQK